MALKNRLKKTIWKEGKNNWCRFLEKITSDTTKLYNKGLWRMLKWSRWAAEETLGDPYLSVLRWTEQDQYTNNNEEKIKILAERFFPGAGQADLQDTSSQSLPPPIEISHTISVKEIKDAI